MVLIEKAILVVLTLDAAAGDSRSTGVLRKPPGWTGRGPSGRLRRSPGRLGRMRPAGSHRAQERSRPTGRGSRAPERSASRIITEDGSSILANRRRACSSPAAVVHSPSGSEN